MLISNISNFKLYTQPTADACFLPVVQSAAQAFSSAGRAGKLFMFHSALPTANAPGKLQNRDDRKLIGKQKLKLQNLKNFQKKKSNFKILRILRKSL